MNDIPVIVDICYAHRMILESPGGKHCKSEMNVQSSFSVKSSVFGYRLTHFPHDFVRGAGDLCCSVEITNSQYLPPGTPRSLCA